MTKHHRRPGGKGSGAARSSALAGTRSALASLAAAEASAGRLPQAEALLRQLLSRNREDADTLFQLGLVLRRQRRWDDAIAVFQSVIDRRPASAGAHYQKAWALAEMRRLAE